MGNNEKLDFYSAAKTMYILSKLSGWLFYSVEGPVGNRRVFVTKRNYIIITLQYILFLYYFYITAFKKYLMDFESIMKIDNIPKSSVLIGYFLLYTGIYAVQMMRGEIFLDVYKRFEKLSNFLEKNNSGIDYKKLRRYCKFIVFIKILNMVLLFFRYYDSVSYKSVLFNGFCDYCDCVVTIQVAVVFYSLKLMAGKLNEKIENLKCFDLNVFRFVLDECMDFHSDMYDLCVIGNGLFYFLITKIFTILASFVFSLHRFYRYTEDYNFFSNYEMIMWTMHNFSCILIITASVVYANNEVRFKLILHHFQLLNKLKRIFIWNMLYFCSISIVF